MASEVANRRLSTALTLTVLVVLLVIGALIGLKALFEPIDGNPSADPSPACTPTQVGAPGRIESNQVTVSVYNAGNRAGLASETLDDLTDRAFKAGEAGNAPEGTKVNFVQVWTTEKKDRAARLVALQFGRNTVVRIHDDLGPGVEVIVGSGFKGLVDAPRSIKSAAEVREVCVAP